MKEVLWRKIKQRKEKPTRGWMRYAKMFNPVVGESLTDKVSFHPETIIRDASKKARYLVKSIQGWASKFKSC